MNMKDRTIFAGLLPASPTKPKQGKATFDLHVRYASGMTMSSTGTKAACLAGLDFHRNTPHVAEAHVTRYAFCPEANGTVGKTIASHIKAPAVGKISN